MTHRTKNVFYFYLFLIFSFKTRKSHLQFDGSSALRREIHSQGSDHRDLVTYGNFIVDKFSSLQDNCNSEGFNMVSDRSDVSKVRIGILGNNENNLVTCDSRIGSGSGGKHNNDVSCGNNGIKTMGYILVQ